MIMLVVSAAAIVAMIILWVHGLYFFISPPNFHFAVVSKKTMAAAKGKKALECREDLR
jgi:hypothetical protein